MDALGFHTVVPVTTFIEALGSTSLVEVGSYFYLDSIRVGSGPQLKYAGAPALAGQCAPFAPIGAEQTAGGYDVARKAIGADQYSVWSTDSSGNYLSNLTGVVSGGSAALESLETTFHQDLNGDGVTGVPPAQATGGIPSGPVSQATSVVFGSNDAFTFRAGAGFSANTGWSDPIEPGGFASIIHNAELAAFLNDTQSGLLASTNGGYEDPSNHDGMSMMRVQTTDPHGGFFIIH